MNSKFAGVLIAAGCCFSTVAAQATEVLTFEGLANLEPVDNYYNGGFGGSGSGPGPSFGVTFTSDSLALISSAGGGTGNFSNNPSGDTVLFFETGADTMNVAAGFNTGFSFFYADQVGFTGTVSVYSGLNGTGTLLASLSLPSTPDPYTVWVPIGVTFAGTAESAIFSGSADYIGFDDITLGSSTPGATPLPAALPLFATGLGALGLFGWRRKRKAFAAIAAA